MSFNAKKAAEKLFEIADVIEKQASQQTFFVCGGCNHTANLETINSVRAKFASDNNIESAHNASVDSVITCRACGGDMKYAATEESEKFFVEAAEKEEDVADAEVGEETIEDDIVADPSEDDAEEVVEDVSDEAIEEPAEKEEKKEEKRTTKDKEDTDGKVEKKEEPKVQFGDDDKKASKTAAFNKAVDRYSNS